MIEQQQIRLDNRSETALLAASLVTTWYDSTVTIGLSGDLGAGKTALVQELAKALGISSTITSPTFALEQRYKGAADSLIHIDLYRLDEADSKSFLAQTEDESAVRCVEWIERIGSDFTEHIDLHIDLQLINDSRLATLTWYDETIPDTAVIEKWRQQVELPAHIAEHCDTVARVAATLADYWLASHRAVRKDTLIAAARCHDLLRFLDFKDNLPTDAYPDNPAGTVWPQLKEQYSGLSHEAAVSQWLLEHNHPVLSKIVALHGVRQSPTTESTIEQKLLYYADKRVALTDIVTVDERFADFQKRYRQPTPSPEALKWFAEVKAMESHLFPDGPPPL